MIIMQGDAYSIPIQIETESGNADANTFSDVEIVIGTLAKKLSTEEISYDSARKAFLFPIKQEESFAMRSAIQPAQVRVLTKSEEVIGVPLGDINIDESLSKELLQVD